MSKIGKKPIEIPEGVQVSLVENLLKVKGPKGELGLDLHSKVQIKQDNKVISVTVKDREDRRQRALWGTFRSLVRNMITGVTAGFEKKLEITGVGYKASVAGTKLVLNLGYSHPIEIEIPKGLEVKVEQNTINIAGADRQAVGEFAALIRSQRKPEPYKGKGIKYQGEVIRRKAGKVVKAVGG